MPTTLEFLIVVFALPIALILFSIGAMVIPFVYNLLVPGETIKETALYWTYEIYKERWKWRKEDKKRKE